MKKIIFFIMVCIFQINYASEAPITPKGLINLGNTCYLNSVVQCLLPNESFRNAILSYKSQPRDNEEDKELTLSLQSLIHEMQNSPQGPLYPYNLVNSANQCTFGLGQAGMQQDAEEFFVQLIDHLYPKPALKDLFTIKYTYKKIYNGVEVNNTERNLSYLNIPYDYLPAEKRANGMAIEPLIKSFFSVPKKAMVEGKNLDKIKGTYLMSEENNFIEGSDILVVTAPRLDLMYEKQMIPVWTLQHQFYLSKKNDPSTKYWYSIIGAVLHTGRSLKEGHYAAVCRYGNQWYFCNDESIEPITEGRLGNILQGERQGFFWGKRYQAYLFFFERAKNQHEVSKPIEKKATPELLKRYSHRQLGKKVSAVAALTSSSASSGSLSDID